MTPYQKRTHREAAAMGESWINGNRNHVAGWIGNSATKLIRVRDFLEVYGRHGAATDLTNSILRRRVG